VKHLESDDPFELVGVTRAREIDIESDRNTARCLVEEYALTGFAAREIFELFASPAYTMPNAIFQRRGPAFIRELITGVFGVAL
jgi:hypothetical protein